MGRVEYVMFFRRVAFLGLTLIVALAPLPLGSNRDWSWAPLASLVGAFVFVQALSALHPGIKAFQSFRALCVPACLLAMIVGWGLTQAFGWTPVSWENPIRVASEPSLPVSSYHPVALEGEQVMTGLMRLLTYIGVFVLAADLTAEPRDARRIYGVAVWSAVGYTLYSMFAEVANRMTIATGISMPTPFAGVFSGPFINRNNYATYASMAALAALVLTIGAMRAGASSTWEEERIFDRWPRLLSALSSKGGLFFVAIAILVTGVLLSGSRGGWVSLAVGLIFAAALLTRNVRRWSVVAATLLGFIALVFLMPAGSTLLTRGASLIEHGEEGREYLFSLTTYAISLRPVVGWGMNSFSSLYSVFQPTALSDTFDKAHNTYLELAFDFGVPVAAALIVAVMWIVVRCLRGLSKRRRHRELTGLGVCVAITAGTHALFDFSLQIPGVAVVFAALLGAAWAQSWSRRRDVI